MAVKIQPNNYALATFKKAEDNGEVVLKFFVTGEEEMVAEIELYHNIERVTVADLRK